MALRTDYKNDELNTSVNTERQFEEVTNPNGTKSYRDVTDYSQVGDSFDADLVNSQNAEINAKAPLDSPAFTGTPTAPTQPQSTVDDTIATTAYVKSAFNNFIDPNLRTSGKAADAQVTGNRIRAVQESVPTVDTTLTMNGAAADAKSTGDHIASAIKSVEDEMTERTEYFTGFLTWEVGGWQKNQSTNKYEKWETDTRCRATFIPLMSGKAVITKPNTNSGSVTVYSASRGFLITMNNDQTQREFEIIASDQIYFSYGLGDTLDPTVAQASEVGISTYDPELKDDLNELDLKIRTLSDNTSASLNELNADVDEITEEIIHRTEYFTGSLTWEIGGWYHNPDTGEYQKWDTDTRCRATLIPLMNGKGVITKPADTTYSVTIYSASRGFLITISTDQIRREFDIIASDQLYFSLSNSNETNPTIDETDDVVISTYDTEIVKAFDEVEKDVLIRTEYFTGSLTWEIGGWQKNENTGEYEKWETTTRCRSTFIPLMSGKAVITKPDTNTGSVTVYSASRGFILTMNSDQTEREFDILASDQIFFSYGLSGSDPTVEQASEIAISTYDSAITSEIESVDAKVDALSASTTNALSTLNNSISETNSEIKNRTEYFTGSLTWEVGGWWKNPDTGKYQKWETDTRCRAILIPLMSGKAIIKKPANTTFSVTVYSASRGFILTMNSDQAEREFDLLASDAIYLSASSSNDAPTVEEVSVIEIETITNVETDLTVAVNDSLNAAEVAMGGILKRWIVNSSITATIYNNGTFWLSGKGEMPLYSNTKPPAWNDNKYMRCVNKVIIDETITINYGLYALFTQYDENHNHIKYQNQYLGSIDYTPNITCIYDRDYQQFDFHHINLAKHKTPFLRMSDKTPVPNRFRHSLFSVPKEVCTTEFINAVINALNTSNALIQYSGVTLLITDSEELNNQFMRKVDTMNIGAKSNVASMLVPDLAEDGFPSHWTEPMKRCLLELIPFVGRQSVQFRDENAQSDDAYPYRSAGLASMNTYSGYGWPEPFGYKSVVDIQIANYAAHDYDSTYKSFQAWWVTRYRGQPWSPDLYQPSKGLTCSGFINWVYWRYFKENFGLSASNGFNRRIGPFDEPLPLKEILFSQLQPFDILNFAFDTDKDGVIEETDGGGHCALFIGRYIDADGKEKIVDLDCCGGVGIGFNRWKPGDEWVEQYDQIDTSKALRLDKGGLSLNVLSYYDIDADDSDETDDGSDESGSDPDDGSEKPSQSSNN